MDFLLEHPELHQKFRDGDRETMAMVYDEYEPDILKVFSGGFTVESTGMRVPPLTNPDDIVELINETFAQAFADPTRGRYDGKREYRRFIRGVARNLRVTHYRKHNREKPSSDRESYEDAAVIFGSPAPLERSPVPPEAQVVIDQYFATAPDRIRALCRARLVDDLSERATADLLGISRERFCQLEERMLRELRKLMKRAGVHSSADRLTPSPGDSRNG